MEVSLRENPWYTEKQVWVFRAGLEDEYVNTFRSNNVIGIYWNIEQDLALVNDWEELAEICRNAMGLTNPQSVGQNAGMVWRFAYGMKVDDLVLTHVRTTRSLMLGKIVGDYGFNRSAEGVLKHTHSIEWYDHEISRDNLTDEMTIKVNTRNTLSRMLLDNAPQAVMDSYHGTSPSAQSEIMVNQTSHVEGLDAEAYLSDLIAQEISRRFPTYEMERLVEGILQAKGYQTFSPPPGPDGGVDILASKGDLGFGTPKICVQVKSGQSPTDRPVLDQLIGTMRNFNADQGLLVSWGGFRSSVIREKAKHFFNVRLWDSQDLINEVLNEYHNLPSDIQQKLPLKRIWTLDEASER
ncbi:restriction endonuclease [Chloroflexi bacterium]|nr:restriction endonuclease [Chloroflexota bacterium]